MTEPYISTPIRRVSALDVLAKACQWLALLGLVIITLVQAWQVFARYVLNNSPGWTEPVSVFFMSMTVMLAAAVGVREGTHFSFSNILDALPEKINTRVRLLLNLVIFFVAILLAYWGVRLMVLGLDVKMAGAPLPVGIRFLPFAIGASAMALFAVERLFVRTKV
jgi:TRAP-type C4-dicarboxylate transport system permease small subunit